MRWVFFVIAVLGLLFLQERTAQAPVFTSRTIFEEKDASPSSPYWKVVVPNALLVENTDGSANLEVGGTGGGALDGGGTANYVVKWTDADTLTSSGIVDTSNTMAFTIDAGESIVFEQNLITKGLFLMLIYTSQQK
mgnify:FL=1